jgi:hypothetical protein
MEKNEIKGMGKCGEIEPTNFSERFLFTLS